MSERFIPFRRSDLVGLLAQELPSSEREAFRGFAKMLAGLLHQTFQERIEALKDAYHPFNREADTVTVTRLSTVERRAARERLETELAALAEAANYTRLEAHELEQALDHHSLLKVRLEVNQEVVEKFLFFQRGQSQRTEKVPVWFGLGRKTVSFTSYARVLVYATFKDESHFKGTDLERLPFRPGSTVLKLFQNVPQADLEMVFPHVQIRMRRIDKVLIGIPALVSGIVVIVTKMLTALGSLLLLIAFWLGIRDEPAPLNQAAMVSIGIGTVAFGAYLVRQVTNFKNRKILFMKALSENLYFRNLDNDAGVFHHLLDAAEEAEVIEALLAYHFLRRSPVPLTQAELDKLVEQWFWDHWEVRLDFEVADGMRKLRELDLVSEDDQGRCRAVPLALAMRRMDLAWESLFSTWSA